LGNITFIFGDEIVQNWYGKALPQQGAQETYSDICIEVIVPIKTVFRLPYQQARGFAKGLLELMQIPGVRVLSFTQVNRRLSAL
jgi:hypothetical protein